MRIQLIEDGRGLLLERALQPLKDGRLTIQVLGANKAPLQNGVLAVNGTYYRAVKGVFTVQLRTGKNELAFTAPQKTYSIEPLIWHDGMLSVESKIGTEEQYIDLLQTVESLRARVDALARSVAGRTENNGYQLF